MGQLLAHVTDRERDDRQGQDTRDHALQLDRPRNLPYLVGELRQSGCDREPRTRSRTVSGRLLHEAASGHRPDPRCGTRRQPDRLDLVGAVARGPRSCVGDRHRRELHLQRNAPPCRGIDREHVRAPAADIAATGCRFDCGAPAGHPDRVGEHALQKPVKRGLSGCGAVRDLAVVREEPCSSRRHLGVHRMRARTTAQRRARADLVHRRPITIRTGGRIEHLVPAPVQGGQRHRSPHRRSARYEAGARRRQLAITCICAAVVSGSDATM
jgi:hypothetical protein